MQVLRRPLRLRMSRSLAPAPLVEAVPLRTSADSYLANGQAIRDDEARSLLDPGRLQRMVESCWLLPVVDDTVRMKVCSIHIAQ